MARVAGSRRRNAGWMPPALDYCREARVIGGRVERLRDGLQPPTHAAVTSRRTIARTQPTGLRRAAGVAVAPRAQHRLLGDILRVGGTQRAAGDGTAPLAYRDPVPWHRGGDIGGKRVSSHDVIRVALSRVILS